MPKQLTIRGVSDEVGCRLEAMGREKGRSVNSIVVGILEDAVGIDQRRERLVRYVTWTAEDQIEFETALDDKREIENEVWQ